MKCPECGSANCHAVETRVRNDNAVRRRRECLACLHRWSTLERIYDKLPHPKRGMERPSRFGPVKRKLTDEQVITIYVTPETNVALAKRFGVSRQLVQQIKRRKVYAKITADIKQHPLCTECDHWSAKGYCTMGFPDPEELGVVFAAECSLYTARTQSTSLD